MAIATAQAAVLRIPLGCHLQLSQVRVSMRKLPHVMSIQVTHAFE